MNDKRRILVVDDEEIIRSLFYRIFLNKRHRVVCVSRGQEAVEKLRSDDFDIVFTDIMMPGMDGVATLKAIREIKPDLPIVMMTGYSVPGKIQESLKLGAVDYLYKPFDVNEVHVILSRFEKMHAQKKLLTSNGD